MAHSRNVDRGRVSSQRSSKSAKSKPGVTRQATRDQGAAGAAGYAGSGGLPCSRRDQDLRLVPGGRVGSHVAGLFADPQFHGRAALPEPQFIAPDPVPGGLLARGSR